MQKKKFLIAFPILLLAALFLLCIHHMIKAPIEILGLQAFHIDKYCERIAFNIDCRNVSHKKTVDSLILSFVCDSDEENTFQCRVLEPEGILPDTNYQFVIDFYKYDLPVEDIATVEVFVSQVNFTDGTSWEDNKIQKSIIAQVDGNIGDSMFPVKINEALFYEESAVTYRFEPIHFQIDWSNISEEESIINVIYKVTAKTLDGTVILSENGDDAVYISDFFEKPDEWIPPLADNKKVVQEYTIHNPLNNYRENGAVIYEVSVCRAVTSKGIILENTDENDCIVVAMCGKKGYACDENSLNPSIQRLIERLDDEFQEYEMNMSALEVFVKNHQYCVLRYPNIDIRVELSEMDEVLSDKVGFVYYSKLQYDDPEGYIQSVYDKMELLRLSICASVFTGISNEEVVQKVREYNHNNKPYINFADLSYDTFEGVFNILDENKNIINCVVFACGKDLYYPPDKLLWVRESPYESQQNLEVEHRQ